MSGRFAWFDLMTPEPEAATAFYAGVLDWGTQAWDGPMPYTMFTVGGEPMGGVMKLPEEATKMGAPPHWLGYVAVTDIEAATAKATSLGATVRVPPTEIPGTGQFSVLSDPQGATVALYQSANPPQGDGKNKGVSWHELMTTDLDAAWSFYEAMFGWSKTEAMDMGEMGTYQLFGVGGQSMGGMMVRPPNMPVSSWLFYLSTDDTSARVEKAKAAGAQLLHGPQEVPGGDLIATLTDPQGAVFAVHARKPA